MYVNRKKRDCRNYRLRQQLSRLCGCDLTAEWLLAREHVRAQLPATAPAFVPLYGTTARQANLLIGCASARGEVSKTLPTPGSTEATCQIKNRQSETKNYFGVVADKQCTCPASKFMWERYPPTPPAFARSAARARPPRRSAAEAGRITPAVLSYVSASHFIAGNSTKAQR